MSAGGGVSASPSVSFSMSKISSDGFSEPARSDRDRERRLRVVG